MTEVNDEERMKFTGRCRITLGHVTMQGHIINEVRSSSSSNVKKTCVVDVLIFKLVFPGEPDPNPMF